MKKNIHVVPNDKGWAVKKEKTQRATKVVTTQGEAIQIGKNHAKQNGAELIIHGKNGQIRQRNSYGNDPFPPKG